MNGERRRVARRQPDTLHANYRGAFTRPPAAAILYPRNAHTLALPLRPHTLNTAARTLTRALRQTPPTDSRPLDLKIEKLKHSPDYRDPCRWSVSALRSPRLALFISERENCVSTRYVCTFILLPFVAGFNLQRISKRGLFNCGV